MKRMLIALTLAFIISGTALAGETPGVGSSVVGDVPITGAASTGETQTPPAPGEMPGVGAATSSTTNTNPSLVTTVLLTIITTLIGR
jgi:hypothetical protein